MIVVPALAESDQRKHPVILAGIGGGKAAFAKKVRERIDGESAMPQEHGAEAETPSEETETADEPDSSAEKNGRHEIVFVKPAELREFGKVADVIEARAFVLVGKNPANMGPPESEERGRVQIEFLIGIAVMMAMMSGPPEDALLRRGHGHEGK